MHPNHQPKNFNECLYCTSLALGTSLRPACTKSPLLLVDSISDSGSRYAAFHNQEHLPHGGRGRSSQAWYASARQSIHDIQQIARVVIVPSIIPAQRLRPCEGATRRRATVLAWNFPRRTRIPNSPNTGSGGYIPEYCTAEPLHGKPLFRQTSTSITH